MWDGSWGGGWGLLGLIPVIRFLKESNEISWFNIEIVNIIMQPSEKCVRFLAWNVSKRNVTHLVFQEIELDMFMPDIPDIPDIPVMPLIFYYMRLIFVSAISI